MAFGIPSTISINGVLFDSTQVNITTNEGVDFSYVQSLNFNQEIERSHPTAIGSNRVLGATAGRFKLGNGSISMQLSEWLTWFNSITKGVPSADALRISSTGLNIIYSDKLYIPVYSIILDNVRITNRSINQTAADADAIVATIDFTFELMNENGTASAITNKVLGAVSSFI